MHVVGFAHTGINGKFHWGVEPAMESSVSYHSVYTDL